MPFASGTETPSGQVGCVEGLGLGSGIQPPSGQPDGAEDGWGEGEGCGLMQEGSLGEKTHLQFGSVGSVQSPELTLSQLSAPLGRVCGVPPFGQEQVGSEICPFVGQGFPPQLGSVG